MDFLKMLGKRNEVSPRIRCAYTSFQMPDAPQNSADSIRRSGESRHRVREAERNPRTPFLAVLLLVERVAKFRRRHANHRERPFIQVNSVPYDVWCSGELPLPEAVAQHDDGIPAAEAVFLFFKHATERRMHPKQGEVVRRAIRYCNSYGMFAIRER